MDKEDLTFNTTEGNDIDRSR